MLRRPPRDHAIPETLAFTNEALLEPVVSTVATPIAAPLPNPARPSLRCAGSGELAPEFGLVQLVVVAPPRDHSESSRP